MLGKLIKHEWKAVAKVLAIMHIALVLMAIIGKIMLSIDILKEGWPLWSALLCLYVLSVIAVGVGTHIYLAFRFYKNMYTDEGYLSFTLPVKPWEHIFAKTLVSCIWIIIDGVAIAASIIILVMYKGMGTEFLQAWNEIVTELSAAGVISVWEVIQLVFIVVISLISIPLTYYFSISIGQLFNSHKMLASVVTYFIIVNVLQVISTIISAICMMGTMNKIVTDDAFSISIYNSVMNIGMVEQLVVMVAFWMITNFIMNKKLNLE